MLNLLNRIITPPRGVGRPTRETRLPTRNNNFNGRTPVRLSPLDNSNVTSIPSNIVDEILNRQHQRFQRLQSIPESRNNRPTRPNRVSIPSHRQPPIPNRRPPRPPRPTARRPSRATARQPSRNILSPRVSREDILRPSRPQLRPSQPPAPNFSITEHENFDLALGIQASLGSVSTHDLPPVNVPQERSQTMCPICLEEIDPTAIGSMRSRMATCGHVFHRRCLRRWKNERQQQHQRYECPVCRFVLS